MNDLLLSKAARFIEQADALVIAAGAGMGVDSGLPDFRGTEGFWKAYPALARARMDFATVASPDTFREDPALAWGFYGHRLKLYRDTVPHRGFGILRQWGESMAEGYSVFTSNVDGQFQRAGHEPRRIVECHGSIHHLQCLEPCSADIWEADDFVPVVDAERCRLLNEPPRCPHCGGLARPNILMFGDSGWVERRALMQDSWQEHWLKHVVSPVVIELGAGSAIPSVRHFGQRLLMRHNATRIRINPRESAVQNDQREVGLPMGALEGLEAIAGVLGN